MQLLNKRLEASFLAIFCVFFSVFSISMNAVCLIVAHFSCNLIMCRLLHL